MAIWRQHFEDLLIGEIRITNQAAQVEMQIVNPDGEELSNKEDVKRIIKELKNNKSQAMG